MEIIQGSESGLSVRGFFDSAEIDYCKKTVAMRIASRKTDRAFRHKEETEECILHDYNPQKLKKMLLGLTPYKFQPYTLYRVVADPKANFMLTVFYDDVTSSAHARVAIPDLSENLGRMSEHPTGFEFEAGEAEGRTVFAIRSINSSKSTVINNVVETFLKHRLFPSYLEIWYIKGRGKQRVKSMYIIKAVAPGAVPEGEVRSLRDDFERYLHRYIQPMSVFDIVGPSMVGPSSSHTAGACKIGQIARRVVEARERYDGHRATSVSVTLYGSFRDTGPGHYTPSAIGGGLYGLPTDHPQLIHNGDPAFLAQNGFEMNGHPVAFGGYRRGDVDAEARYKSENNANIAEIHVATDAGSYSITGFSIGGGNVEVRYIGQRLATPITGKEDLWYADGQMHKAAEARKLGRAELVAAINPPSKQAKPLTHMPFSSFEELDAYLSDGQRRLVDVVLETEQGLQGTSRDEIMTRVAEYWRIMKASVRKGTRSRELSLLKLTGRDAHRIDAHVRRSRVFDNLYGRAVAYATAVNEVNAKCGVIIACPTAGSCGIVPGVLQAYSEIEKPARERILESILVAGFMGMILFSDVTTAGADYGCQAEVGVGAAMGAAALAYLEGGTHRMVIHAFALALKNSLGLICDPVAGLVEVPCVKRNGIFTSVAISASLMALAGVESFVSPDEVVLTMKEVGDKLHSDYKETAGGGLAKTRDGKAVDRAFESEVRRFFGDNN